MAVLRLRRNGPLVVEGDDVRLVDWDGVERQPTKLPIALCRCGGSSNKPFCDGSHRRIGFAPDPLADDSRKPEG
jgi:CDGSH-type Zn-finger protein